MKIIGIRIIAGDSVVIKNLQPGWYPFGHYEEPSFAQRIIISKWESEINEVYQVYPKLPQISVSCIVGKNGAGKTTMIDIMLRLINNFAYYLLDGKADDTNEYRTEKGRKLSYANGLNAKMYFEIDGNLGMIDCQNEELTYQIQQRNGRVSVYDRQGLMRIKNKGDLLKSFFYTIECNYSQYGFRPSDYESQSKENGFINGEWIEGLFHKNDGYLSPAVLTPFRDNGLIDYVQEERLANRRLITLSILYYTQGKQFVPGYNPVHLTYSFNRGFIDERQTTLAKSTKVFNATQIGYLMDHFSNAWEKLLYENLDNVRLEEERNALLYLGYKSLKICLKYRNYQRRFALKSFSEALDKGGNAFEEYTHDEKFFKRINAIVNALNKDTSHIALKIHQCIAFVNKGMFTESKMRVTVDEYLRGLPRYTYDNVFKALPPAYFNIDLTMTQGPEPNKRLRQEVTGSGEFHFSQMSSGERQLMNSMSYILYHIKNIQSIKADADRVAYHHINLIFDEAELYFHPDYQRYLVRRIIDMLHLCHIDRRRIRSINIILATHSPYVLSDVFTQKSLYLKEGHYTTVDGQSFGANYYNMLQDSFFFEESPMGEIATQKIQEWIDKMDYDKTELVGDPIIKSYLERIKSEKNVPYRG